MTVYALAVFAHVICGAILAMTLVIMQLVVSPAAARMTNAEDKKLIGMAIQTRWHPVVDAAIIIQTVTALFFMVTRWEWIGSSTILHVKVTTGIITLSFANALHFYYRGKKRRLKAAGEVEKLSKTNKRTQVMEKVVLVMGVTTYLLALLLNHNPF
ncbi:MAG: hypothetical protein ACE5EN_11505 [Nitrospinota bacterium]